MSVNYLQQCASEVHSRCAIIIKHFQKNNGGRSVQSQMCIYDDGEVLRLWRSVEMPRLIKNYIMKDINTTTKISRHFTFVSPASIKIQAYACYRA